MSRGEVRAAGVAQLLTQGDRARSAGMAIAIDRRHVLTCAHVVNAALGRPFDAQPVPDESLVVAFPYCEPENTRSARVQTWKPAGSALASDVAVLELDREAPDEAGFASFAVANATNNHEFNVFGFRQGSVKGNYIAGRFMGTLPDGTVQIDGLNDIGIFIESGFSGAGVWGCAERSIVGMVSARNVNPAERVAYMIPTAGLKAAWPELRVDVPAPSIGPVSRADRNRQHMIEKVRKIWIDGFLDDSLINGARVRLTLSDVPDAVARPLDAVVGRHPAHARSIPLGIGIASVYDETPAHALLILGEPGAGKSSLLLELARTLLERASRDPGHPIPVVFPLTTWAQSRKPISEWMADELKLRYDIPAKLAAQWVEQQEILPLLDGLDEVASHRRTDCVTAINEFRREHGLLPTVVTCRLAEYEALAQPLRLQHAVRIHPVGHTEMSAYLDDLQHAGAVLREAVACDPSLTEFLNSPLMLNVACMALKSDAKGLDAAGTPAQRRERLFDSYIDQVLHRGGGERRFTPDQTVRWLTWLASQMKSRGLTVFFLEQLQFDWLPKRWQSAARIAAGIVPGLICASATGLLLGLIGAHLVGPEFGLALGLASGLPLAAVICDVRGEQNITCAESLKWSYDEFRRKLPKWLAVGIVAGSLNAILVEHVSGIALGLVGGFCGALSGGWRVAEDAVDVRIAPNQGIRRSLSHAIRWALVGGVFAAVLQGFIGSYVGSATGVRFGAWFGALFGFLFGALALAKNNGGTAVVNHLALRGLLACQGAAPLNYVAFLDHAAHRVLLRKVGGGYAFIHRTILDHFAANGGKAPKAESGAPSGTEAEGKRE